MKALLLLIVIAGLGGGAWWYLESRGEMTEVAVSEDVLATAVRGDLAITVVENGFLKAKNSVNVDTQFEREGKISWLIEEGDEVEEGDILVEFEKTEIEENISEYEQRVIQYEAELEAARADLQIQERDSKAAIEAAELKEHLVSLALERYEKGEYPNELRKLNLAEEKARSEFERTQESFEQVPQLEKEGFLTKIQVEEERIKLREAEINMENAIRDRELFEKYTYVMDSTQKKSDLKDAKRELENSKQKATIGLKEKQAVVTQKERTLQSTKARLERTKDELKLMTLRAPGPGIVHYGHPDRPWTREEVKVGNSLWQGHTVVTLPDLREMQVMVQVHEADVDSVKEEMAVDVTVETHKGHTFAGKVTDIATVASSRNWTDAGNRTFQVEITMAPGDVDLRAGVTARAEIQVDELKDVLYVPIHAVVAEQGSYFCFVWDGVEIDQRTVTIGRSNAHYVVVESGLSEGDRVFLYDPRQSGFSAPSSEGGEEESGGNPLTASASAEGTP